METSMTTLTIFDENLNEAVVVAPKGRRNNRGGRPALNNVNLNKTTASRIAASKKKTKLIEERAQELRDSLCGGGWCANSEQPSWLAHDKKVEKKLLKTKGVSEKAKDVECPLGLEDDATGDSTKEDMRRANAILDRWAEDLRQNKSVMVDVDAIEMLRAGLEAAFSSSDECKLEKKAPPTLVETRLALQAAMERLFAGDASAEIDVDKLDQAVQSHPDYALEKKREREDWDAANAEANEKALMILRRCVPPEPSSWSLARLEEKLPAKLAKRIFRKRALHLVRMAPSRIAKLHIVELRGKYDASGLSLNEARALFAALPCLFENDPKLEKKQWKEDLRQTLAGLITKNKDQPNEYADIDAFDETLSSPDDEFCVKSNLNDGAAIRALELAALKKSCIATKQSHFAASSATKKKKTLVVHLKSPSSATKIKKKRVSEEKSATRKHKKAPFIFEHRNNKDDGGNALMDQLKARLRARQEKEEPRQHAQEENESPQEKAAKDDASS